MNVRIFGVRTMECMCAQTRPRVILSSERVLGIGVTTHVDSKGKIPFTGGSEEGRTGAAASRRTGSPTHYRLSYSAPVVLTKPRIVNLWETRVCSNTETASMSPRERQTWGRYHGGRRPSSDDSLHSSTVIPPSALDKPNIMKRYHRRRTTR